MRNLRIKSVGLTAGLFLSITYVICVVFDLIFPGLAMYPVWERLLPGFKWLTLWTFMLGLVEAFLYGIYLALIVVPLYNLFSGRIGVRKAN